MARFKTFLLVSVIGALAAACGPVRPTFDAQSDVPQPDIQTPDAADDVVDAMDAPTDGTADASDARMCDPATCDMACLSAGLPGGVCRASGCMCIGGGSDAGDATRRDAGPDARVDAGIINCTINTDCPPTMYCNGPGCAGTGFCALRPDPGFCDMEGPTACGCDRMTYTNQCARQAAGVRLDPTGSMCSVVVDGGRD